MTEGADKTIALHLIVKADKAKSIEEVEEVLEEINKELKKTGKSAEEIEKLTAASEKLNQKMSQVEKTAKDSKSSLDKVGKSQGVLSKGFGLMKEKMSQFITGGGELRNIMTSLQGAMGNLDFSSIMSLSKGLGGATKGAKGLAGGFKLLRMALISTGIGAIVVALGSLLAYFTKTKRGSEMLSRGMAGLGAAVSVIIDKASAVGEILVNAFKNPKESLKKFGDFLKKNITNRFKGLLETVSNVGQMIGLLLDGDFDKLKEKAKELGTSFIKMTTGFDKEQQQKIVEGFKDLTKEIAEEANEAMRLEGILQRVADAKRSLMIQEAKAQVVSERAKLAAQDESKTLEERIEFLREAAKAEEDYAKSKRAITALELSAIRQKNALGESMADDLENEARLKADLIRIDGDLARKKAELFGQEKALMAQQKAKEEAAKAEAERKRKEKEEAEKRFREEKEALEKKIELELAGAEEREVLQAKAKYAALIAEAEKYGLETQALTEAQERALADIREKYKEEEKRKEFELQQSKLEMTAANLGNAAGLLEDFASQNESIGKEVFAFSKILRIAEATINTYAAATQALATLPYPYGAIAAGLAIAQGLAQVTAISQTKLGGGIPSRGGIGANGVRGSAPNVNNATVLRGQQPVNVIQAPINVAISAEEMTEKQRELEGNRMFSVSGDDK